MTVRELRKIIADLPDEMLVGGSGHFGEYLECYEIYKTTVRMFPDDNRVIPLLCILMEDAGDAPD
jgi:hypothetical protein